MIHLEHIVASTMKKATETASAIQRQAPAARMIGEFAVKQLTKEVEKFSRRFSAPSRDSSSTDDDKL